MVNKGKLVFLTLGLATTLLGLSLGPISSLLGAEGTEGFNQWSYPTFDTTFRIWEKEPIGDHLFLAFRTPAEFEKSQSRTSISPLYMYATYLTTLPVRLADAPLKVFEFWSVIPGYLALLWFVLYHLNPVSVGGVSGRYITFLTGLWVCVTLTAPSFWVGVLKFEITALGQLAPVIAFCHLSVLDFEDRQNDRSGFIALLVLAALNPLYTPIAIVAPLVMWMTDESALRKLWLKRLGLLAVVGLVCLAWPRVIASLGELQSSGSSLLYRTGLDGSTEHFHSIWQAIFQPVPAEGRQWSFLALPLFALGIIAVSIRVDSSMGWRLARQYGFVCLPYLYFAIVFPQATSIHPYCYDFTLLVPTAFCLAYWSQLGSTHDSLKGRGVILAGLTVAFGFLMTNFIELARFKA